MKTGCIRLVVSFCVSMVAGFSTIGTLYADPDIFPPCEDGIPDFLCKNLPAKAPRCFLDAERPLRDDEPWSAECGQLAPPMRTIGIYGKGENWLDSAVPKCTPQQLTLGSCPDPEAPVVLYPKLPGSFPVENYVWPPKCYPPGKPDYVQMGHVMIHRSCFRSLQHKRPLPPYVSDQTALLDWNKDVLKFAPAPPWDECHLNKFGELEVTKSGSMPRIPAQKKWVYDFLDEYPPRGSRPGTAAEAIYQAYHDIEKTVAQGHCLANLNSDLADRVRQAMGTEFRALPGAGGGGREFYRPNIDCREQSAYFCAPDDCEGAKKGFEGDYNKRGEKNGDEGKGLPKSCKPAHDPGMKLGSIDDSNLKKDDVVVGAPKIHIYNPTATFANRAFGGPSTLFHEFLHAAGAHDSPNHNHGTEDNVLPAGDQVYACQAIAYEAFFDKLTPQDLLRACLTCAGKDVQGRSRCVNVCGDPTKPVCPDYGKRLRNDLGCRQK